MSETDPKDFGKCCACDVSPADGVHVATLNLASPFPTVGWRCRCGNGPLGAIALLCEACAQAGRPPVFVVGPDGLRAPAATLPTIAPPREHQGDGHGVYLVSAQETCGLDGDDVESLGDLGRPVSSHETRIGDFASVRLTPQERLAAWEKLHANRGVRPPLSAQEYREAFPREPGRYWTYDPFDRSHEVEMLLVPGSEIITFTVRRVDGLPMPDSDTLTAADAAVHVIWAVMGVARDRKAGPEADHVFRLPDGSHVATFNLARFKGPQPATKGRL